MKAELNYQPALDFFKQDINSVAESMFNQRVKIMRDCAKVVSAAVVKNLKRSNVDRPLYKHMADGVKIKIKDTQEGEIIAIIGGGPGTAHKWHLVDNGTSDTPAQHFTEKSMSDAEGGIEAVFNSAIFKAVDSNGR